MIVLAKEFSSESPEPLDPPIESRPIDFLYQDPDTGVVGVYVADGQGWRAATADEEVRSYTEVVAGDDSVQVLDDARDLDIDELIRPRERFI